MPDTRLTIAGRIYSVTCQPGEEDHLARLGMMMDAAARKAGATSGLTETRALLFAGLLLADELAEAQDRQAAEPAQSEPAVNQTEQSERDDQIDMAARAIEHLANRIENLAEDLEKSSDKS
ncbi:cell division protein ZapA [Blastomonas sp.]|uniref:cell division protein ZapA n=1 Tax=Blastomonas sp. TaxID=1909299 RepID=UPI00391A904B